MAAFVIALGLPAAAFALTAQGQVMLQRWGLSDRCVAAAQRAFPDYTPEANAKRDAQLKQCLANSNLPPRDLSAAPK
ncbi:MAG TPA: hypothetical protein VG308_21015 [Stellaceae bacterium]|nr:hypothetical protein [Stellaceae bacterium]